MTLELAKSLLGLLAPSLITDNFELMSIREHSTNFVLEFEESADLVPKELSGCEFKLNGFENAVELHTFPQKGKSCFLRIRRRKWVDKQTGKSYSNEYDLHRPGMKTTDELGDFLLKK
jgi:hypothetical protein